MSLPLEAVPDDDLETSDVGDWAERKYRLLSAYAAMFAKSMKYKWDCRVYVDLFAGSGHARIEGTNTTVRTSPLLALGVDVPFDKYIFCEREGPALEALKARVAREHPRADVTFIDGDVNEATDEILARIPAPSPRYKVLSFCFADPFRMQDLQFETLSRISLRFVDFLVLIPSFMDANRNLDSYLRPENRTVELFLGDPAWREDWTREQTSGRPFGAFVASRLGHRMTQLQYNACELEDMVEVRTTRNLPLYHFAFFSRSPLGVKFWKQARKYSTDQRELF